FLKHANAPDVEALLAKLVTGQSTASQRDASSSGRLTNTRLNPAPTAPAPTPGGAPAAPVTPAVAASTSVAEPAASEDYSSLLTSDPDERPNGIVTAGTPNDIDRVKSLIERLGVLLPQLRIEVVIAEVTLTDDASTDISTLGLQLTDN